MEAFSNRFQLGRSLWIVIALVLMLLVAVTNAGVREWIINLDTVVAMATNSFAGHNPSFDKLLALISTRNGDISVAICMGLLLLVHSLSGATYREKVERLSFWAWVGGLCLITYFLIDPEFFNLRRPIPLVTLPSLTNVQDLYHITLRTNPDCSWPSGHALAYTFFALMASRPYPRMSVFFLILAIFMPFIRLIIGIHWLSDILLGAWPISLLVFTLAWQTPLFATYGLCNKAILIVLSKILRTNESIPQTVATANLRTEKLPVASHQET